MQKPTATVFRPLGTFKDTVNIAVNFLGVITLIQFIFKFSSFRKIPNY